MIIEKVEYNKNIEMFVEKEFERFESEHEVFYNYDSFSFVAKEQDEIIGVVAGHTCFSEVYISDLSVKEEYRGKHIGTQLMKTVEEYFKGKDFDNINLITYGFQAPKFYEKLGYQLEFVRVNKNNSKVSKYYFVKKFNEEK